MDNVIGNVAEHFRCSICNELATKAVMIRSCEDNFCSGQGCPDCYKKNVKKV